MENFEKILVDETFSFLEVHGHSPSSLQKLVWDLARNEPEILLNSAKRLGLEFTSTKDKFVEIIMGWDKTEKIKCIKEIRLFL